MFNIGSFSFIALAALSVQTCALGATGEHDRNGFVTIIGDTLKINGREARFFCATGVVPPMPGFLPEDDSDTRKAKWNAAAAKGDDLAVRLRDAGFNMIRLGSIPVGESRVQGQFSEPELYDRFIGSCKDKGLRVWAEVMHPNTSAPVTVADVACLDDPSSASAWTNAVASCKSPADLMLAAPWDPRIEVVIQRRIREWARSLNPYTGLRRFDDPVFALWSFEQLWWDDINAPDRMTLPPFFQNALATAWNNWLFDRFGSDDALRQALPDILPPESVDKGTVRMSTDEICAICRPKQPNQPGCPRIAMQRKFLLNLYAAHMMRVAGAFTMFGEATRKSPIVLSGNFKHDTLAVVSTARYLRPGERKPESKEPLILYAVGSETPLLNMDAAAFAVSNAVQVLALPRCETPAQSVFASQVFLSGTNLDAKTGIDIPALALRQTIITTNGNVLIFPASSVVVSNIAFRAVSASSDTNSIPQVFTNALLTFSLEARDVPSVESAKTLVMTAYATDLKTHEPLEVSFLLSFKGLDRKIYAARTLSGETVDIQTPEPEKPSVLKAKAEELRDRAKNEEAPKPIPVKSKDVLEIPFVKSVFQIQFTTESRILKVLK